jgi:hypothetical protein
MSFPVVLGPTSLQAITPNELRGQVIAVYLFSINLIGLGVGPTLIAIVSDNFLPAGTEIGVAFSIVAGLVTTLALAVFSYASKINSRYDPSD